MELVLTFNKGYMMTHVITRVRDLSPIQELVITYHWTLLLEEKIRLGKILIIYYSMCFPILPTYAYCVVLCLSWCNRVLC